MDVGSWLDSYRRAWEDADAEAAAVLFDDRATYRSNIFQEPYEGPDGVRRYWQEVTASQSGTTHLTAVPGRTPARRAEKVVQFELQPVTLEQECSRLVDGRSARPQPSCSSRPRWSMHAAQGSLPVALGQE